MGSPAVADPEGSSRSSRHRATGYHLSVNTPRLTISKLLAVVAVAAVNLAVARYLYENDDLLVLGPMGLALQFAAFSLWRRRSPFWMGFLVFGALATVSLALTAAWYPAPMPMHARSIVEQVVMWPWLIYRSVVHDLMQSVGLTYAVLPVWVILNVPQFAAAAAGGLMVRRIAREPGRECLRP
jgi:hypothetical protein